VRGWLCSSRPVEAAACLQAAAVRACVATARGRGVRGCALDLHARASCGALDAFSSGSDPRPGRGTERLPRLVLAPMSSYQIKKRGKRAHVEVRRRRQNEKKAVAQRKQQEKASLNRRCEGGVGPLDQGRAMAGAVRVWSLTLDDEYYPDPEPPSPIIVLDGQELAQDEHEHCTARWQQMARTVMDSELAPIAAAAAPAMDTPAPASSDELDTGDSGGADDEATDNGNGGTLDEKEEGDEGQKEGGEEQEEEEEEDYEDYEDYEDEPEVACTVFIIDYSKLAHMLPAESSARTLGPVSKPIARVLQKLNGAEARLVACGAGCLLACKLLQQQTVAERIAQVVLVLPELPGGVNRSWAREDIEPPTVPLYVHGGGEGGVQYGACQVRALRRDQSGLRHKRVMADHAT
jgi:hypothetical protein